MKRHMIISLFCAVVISAFAQNTGTSTDDNQQQFVPNTEPEIVFDDKSPFENIYIPGPQDRSQNNILWKKTVWRMIDMREQVNFPLYFPLQESNGRTNLFLTIFNLLKEGKVNAYQYIDTKEDFSDEYKLTFKEALDLTKIDVYDETTDEDGNTVYDINEVDIPSAQVLKFYLKEVWYFDAMESSMKFKIEAIAPQLYYLNEDGLEQKAVLFWVPFDQLRPWLAKQPVVINNKNSTSFISFDDLFQKRRFLGHIYKEDNLQNRSLIDYCDTPMEVRSEQNRIENEIKNFEFDLWEY